MNAAISLWLFSVLISAADADKAKVLDPADPEPTLVNVETLAAAEAEFLRATVSPNPLIALDAYRSLADLCEKAGFPADAGSYLEQAVARYPNETFADGKTPQAILDDFRARMTKAGRSLPLRADWGDVRQATVEFQPLVPDDTVDLTLYPRYPDLEYFKKHRLQLKKQQCSVIDATTGKATWSVELAQAVTDWKVQGNSPTTFWFVGHQFFFVQDDYLYGVSVFERKILWFRKLDAPSPAPVDHNLHSVSVVIVAAAPGIIAVRNRNELIVLDPLTGRQFWSRPDLQLDAAIVGDSDHLFVVASNGRYSALRAADGHVVRSGQFPVAYRHRPYKSFGRKLLTIERDVRQVSVYLWDSWDEREVGRRDFNARTRLYLGAYERGDWHIPLVEPDGGDNAVGATVIVLDLRNGNTALQASLDCTMDQLSHIDFLMDDDRFYVATEMVGTHLRYSHLTPGVHCVNINGPLTAYDRATQKKLWETDLPNRSVIAVPGAELPVLIVMESKTIDKQGRISTRLEIYDKKTGKELAAKQHEKYLGFSSIAYDANKRTIDLRSWNVNVHVDLSDNAKASLLRNNAGRLANTVGGSAKPPRTIEDD